MQMKRFSDFAVNPNNLEGDKIPIDKVFDKDLTVLAFRILRSKYETGKDIAQIQFELDGNKFVLFTASEVLISQLREYNAEIPFVAVIHREGRYFTFK